MDSTCRRAQAVAVSGDRIVAVGENADILRLAAANTKLVDCQGLTLLPGFIDAHCHLLALARTLHDLDFRPKNARSISALQELVRKAARRVAAGEWVRGHGYDDTSLSDKRHPTRWDLDQVAPDHPVRLDHRSGHATVLNSLGLQLAGIHLETLDPVDGVIERTKETGEPTGVLFEMASFLRQRLGNTRGKTDLEVGVRAASRRLLGYGVTSVQDAGADNGLQRWDTFQQLQSSSALTPRVTMLVGAQCLGEFIEEGMLWGDGSHHLRLGHVKVMLTLTTGALTPHQEGLDKLVQLAHRTGFPVAVHCIEQEAVRAAAKVLGKHPFSKTDPTNLIPKDRMEHCAEGPPDLVDLIRHSGAAVVTQPGFIYWNGPNYRASVAEELQPHLYPAGALHRAGVAVAFGSDAPVIDPNPWPGIHSAATRLTHDGRPVCNESANQAIDLDSALHLYTLAGAGVEGTATDKGSITPGKLADLVLVDIDPLATDPDCVKDVQAVVTMLNGRVVFEGGRYPDSS